MKKLKLFFVIIAGVGFVVLGCSKGSTGPAGPKGPAGPDSVMHSAWITLAPAFVAADTAYEQTITAPAITQSIINNGIILTYLDVGGSGNNQIFPTSAVGFALTETYRVGAIDLFAASNYSGLGFRYVLVPGTISINKIISGPAKGLTKQQLLQMSYEDVENLLGNSKSVDITQ